MCRCVGIRTEFISKIGDVFAAKQVEDRVEKRVGKSLGRKKLPEAVRAARRHLRDLLNQELDAGFRDATNDNTPWTKAAFCRALGASDHTMRDWFRPIDPAPPRRYARKILTLLYGDKPEHAERRAAMRTAMLAAGIEHDELDEALQIDLRVLVSAPHVAGRPELTRLTIYQPLRANEFPQLRIPFDLGIFPDTNKRVPLKGQKTKAVLSIGLTKARFAIESKDWRPTQDSIFGPAGPKSQQPDVIVKRGSAGTLDIEAAKPGAIIHGDPFEGINTIPLEPTRPDADGGATFLVKSPEEAVAITVSGGSPMGEDKKADLLRILFGKVVQRDANDWFVLEREEVAPIPAKSSQE